MDDAPLLSRRSKYILAILMVVAVTAGYVGYLYRSARSIRVESITVEELSLSGTMAHIRIGLDLYNPAIQTLGADKIQYDIYVEDIYIGSGETGPVSLAPRSLTHVSLPINVSIATLGARLMPVLGKAMAQGKLDVAVSGTIKVNIRVSGLGLGSLELPYRISRTISLAG
ncbi:MAG: LEA type 2 family protein [Candidatus Korarchaeota archaeon]|nr:LEA type 2 family protein [Candidatus Korarchaeota archaeon]